MNHGIVDIFAFQEALLIEAVFGLALLTMIWVGFRRWLEHRERMGALIAEQAAERAAKYGAHVESVEARLRALEQLTTDGRVQPIVQIDVTGTDSLTDPSLKTGEVPPKL